MNNDNRVVMRILDIAGPFPCPMRGQFLKSMDFEADQGRGDARFTKTRKHAMVFDDNAAAMKFWRTRSLTVPTRPDGKPNRPLTMYTIELVRWVNAV